MDYRITIPPTEYPVTLAGVKDYLQEIQPDNDALINHLIDAAIEDIQNQTNLTLAAITVEQYHDTWPVNNINSYVDAGTVNNNFNNADRWYVNNVSDRRTIISNCLSLRFNPLISITSVQYYNADGDLITMDPADYYTFIRSNIYFLALKKNVQRPVTDDRANAIIITYKAGYPLPYNVPEPIKQAILLKVRASYDRRMDQLDVDQYNKVSSHLIAPYRIYV